MIKFRELKKWFCCQKLLLLSQRTSVQFQASTWQFSNICDPTSRGPNVSSGLQRCMGCMCMYILPCSGDLGKFIHTLVHRVGSSVLHRQGVGSTFLGTVASKGESQLHHPLKVAEARRESALFLQYHHHMPDKGAWLAISNSYTQGQLIWPSITRVALLCYQVKSRAPFLSAATSKGKGQLPCLPQAVRGKG